jgi:hypothetical protein
MEAEYITLAQAAKRAIHYRRLLHAMGFPQTSPITAFEDNQPAINLATVPALNKRSQHIHVRYHLIRDYVSQKQLQIIHMPTSQMNADLLTKTLSVNDTQTFSLAILNMPHVKPSPTSTSVVSA